jgi:hypothetical protein
MMRNASSAFCIPTGSATAFSNSESLAALRKTWLSTSLPHRRDCTSALRGGGAVVRISRQIAFQVCEVGLVQTKLALR